MYGISLVSPVFGTLGFSLVPQTGKRVFDLLLYVFFRNFSLAGFLFLYLLYFLLTFLLLGGFRSFNIDFLVFFQNTFSLFTSFRFIWIFFTFVYHDIFLDHDVIRTLGRNQRFFLEFPFVPFSFLFAFLRGPGTLIDCVQIDCSDNLHVFNRRGRWFVAHFPVGSVGIIFRRGFFLLTGFNFRLLDDRFRSSGNRSLSFFPFLLLCNYGSFFYLRFCRFFFFLFLDLHLFYFLNLLFRFLLFIQSVQVDVIHDLNFIFQFNLVLYRYKFRSVFLRTIVHVINGNRFFF